MTEYSRGYRDGWHDAYREMGYDYRRSPNIEEGFLPQTREGEAVKRDLSRAKPKKKGKDPTPTLTKMTAPIWKRYKAGSGKKSYFDIRNQVRRSVKYKRAKKTRGA